MRLKFLLEHCAPFQSVAIYKDNFLAYNELMKASAALLLDQYQSTHDYRVINLQAKQGVLQIAVSYKWGAGETWRK